MTPEEKARQHIDELLHYAGWDVQDRDQMNLFDPNRPGVAVREAYLKTGFADYLLFVQGKALGVIEAKKVGVPLSGVEAQSARYAVGLPDDIPAYRTSHCLSVMKVQESRPSSPIYWTRNRAAACYSPFTGRKPWPAGRRNWSRYASVCARCRPS